MNDQISLLIELQKIDSSLDRMTIMKKKLPEQKAALEEGLQQAVEKFEAEKQRLEDVRKTHRQKEDDLKKNVDALKKTKDRLLEVKTNKEYQAMLKEIETLEKRNGDYEEEILIALEAIDKTKKEIEEREKELTEYRRVFDNDVALIDKELGSLDEVFGNLQKDRGALQGQVRTDLLKRYETIKSKRNGYAVATIWKGICEGCHMTLPPQMCIELQKGNEMMECPFCSRILYWDKNRHE